MPTRSHRPRTPVLRGLLLATVFILTLTIAGPAEAVQRLVNSGFESGTTGWLGSVSAAGCPPRSGAAAGLVSSDGAGWTEQRVNVTGGSGPYAASGYARLLSGSARLQVHMRWLSPGDVLLGQQTAEFDLTAAYASFSAPPDGAPAQAAILGLRFQILPTTPAASICIDDLVLDGPTFASPTPLPSATLTPTTTATASATPAPSASPAASASPTSTSVATSTPSPAPTAAPASEPGFRLVNPGFELGTNGWQKYGGELRAVSSPTNNGIGAGLLTSTTTSTKWAYQTVVVEPGGTYEFSGYLRPGEGTSEAYLRIAWYASTDGSGSAIATTDSTTRLPGPASAYAFLTSGAVGAPTSAHSARVRAMLVPAGAGSATLHMDDFSFLPAIGAAASQAPTAAAVAADEPSEPAANDAGSADEGSPARSRAAAGAITGDRPPSDAGARTAAAAAATAVNPPKASDVAESAADKDGGPGTFVWVALTLGFFAFGLGAARVQARRVSRS